MLFQVLWLLGWNQLWINCFEERMPAYLKLNPPPLTLCFPQGPVFMTHLGTLLRLLACSSVMICAFSSTGFPGATFSPRRYRTVVENLDCVLMTWGGCLSTTRELRKTSCIWEVNKALMLLKMYECKPFILLFVRNWVFNLKRNFNSKTQRDLELPLNQDLQKLPKSVLKLWDWLPYQHQFLSQLPIHTEQLLTAIKFIKTIRNMRQDYNTIDYFLLF